VDDAGLGILLGLAGRAREHGGDLRLVCAPGRLRDRLALTGADRAVAVSSNWASTD
jgi:anti-anti-sigma regulatory factor